MRSSFAGLAVTMLAALSGCTKGTPGGPGATTKSSAFGQANDTFNLSAPVMAGLLQQGNQAEGSVGIQRAENFDQDVALKFTDVPKGVTIEPASPVIKHGDTDAKIMFKAGDAATQGDYQVKITGRPTIGTDAMISFKLIVFAQDGFGLNAPQKATLVKQGEKKIVSIGIQRSTSFNQDVLLTFGDLPEGVTLEPKTSTIKHGETEAQVSLAAADDAALGKFAIKVIGHSAKGADASTAFEITVTKE
jgi:hypothetical protein